MAERFKIIWHDGSYRVSIPNYEGGDVVDAASFDELVKALEKIVAIGSKTGYGKMALVHAAKSALNAVVGGSPK